MQQNLLITLARADFVLKELAVEYQRSLTARVVSPMAEQLTHETCILLRCVLDRWANSYWESRVRPELPAGTKSARIYFPAAMSQQQFDSTMGQWQLTRASSGHARLIEALRAVQPYIDPSFGWLAILSELANYGKHIDLVPQERRSATISTVRGPGAEVSWNTANVSFGTLGSVRVAGALVEPATQRICPTPGVSQQIVEWVSFHIPEHGVEARSFCTSACQQTRNLVERLSGEFGL